MGEAPSLFNLPLRGLQIFKKLQALHEGIVFGDIHHDSGAFTAMRNDQGAARLMDLLQAGGDIGAEFRERLYIFFEAQAGHFGLLFVQRKVQKDYGRERLRDQGVFRLPLRSMGR